MKKAKIIDGSMEDCAYCLKVLKVCPPDKNGYHPMIIHVTFMNIKYTNLTLFKAAVIARINKIVNNAL